ncbi:MAG TPA: uracil-DNA glycosylase [Xanthobacteraceae bacterium]|nr:uracil-DNA glycosylase [Xanthobacteraceae bacterium]
MNSGRKDVRDLIAFYLEAGADALLGEVPVDRMADDAAPRPPPAGGRQRRPTAAVDQENADAEHRLRSDLSAEARSATAEATRVGGETPSRKRPPSAALPLTGGGSMSAPPSPDAAIMAAREAAKTAASLDDLRQLLERFEGCTLRGTATQLVFADGDPQARVMFVGEAPGHEEDITGRPFVGRSGKLLDRMMAAIGLDRTSAYIANVVPWRPPGNRTPTPQETAICLPFIRRQIELADPDILVCLGGPATQTLLGTKDGITRTRGRWFKFATGTREIRALATFHPAFLLRSPLQKRFSWRDFLAIKKALAE